MRRWPAITLRAFGALHIAFGVAGAAGILWVYVGYANRALSWQPGHPYSRQLYYIHTVVDLLCVLLLIRAGVALLRLEPHGRLLSNIVLVSELAWFLVELEAVMLLSFWGGTESLVLASMQSVSGIGDIGTIFQELTGYPLIALVATNLAYRKQESQQSPPASGKTGFKAGGGPRPETVVRVFSVLNIAVALYGIDVVAVWYRLAKDGMVPGIAGDPTALAIFSADAAVALLCSALLIPGGVMLWRLKRRGIWPSVVALGILVGFFALEQALRMLLDAGMKGPNGLARSRASSLGVLLFIAPPILFNAVAVLLVGRAFERLEGKGG